MLLSLDGTGPLYQRLYRALREAILVGRLPPATRLPSSRELAAELGVSRNVVLAAFEQLFSEGYLQAKGGSGTFVSRSLPDVDLRPPRAVPATPEVTLRAAEVPRWSRHTQRVLALGPLPAPGSRAKVRYDFCYGVPSANDFPHATWCRLTTRRARAISRRSLWYGRVLGFMPLRQAIVEYLRRARGVRASAEQVVVVNGTQQGLDLVARLLLDPGDQVVVEEPSYQAARQAFVALGARLLPIPADEEGLQVQALPRTRSVRLAYVTPSHQFPLGGTLPVGRRMALLRWAEASGAYLLEDDYDSEFRYEGRPIEAVQGLDRAGRVLYLGSFSKVLAPALRVGYLVVPPSLLPAVAPVRFLMDYHTPTFEQEVLADFIGEGHFERHLRRARRIYGERRATLLAACAERLGERLELVSSNAGLHAVGWLRDVAAARLPELIDRAREAQVGIYPLAPYYLAPPRRAGLLLGYSALTKSEIRAGIGILARVLDRFGRRARPA